jgi:hypothetical protein
MSEGPKIISHKDTKAQRRAYAKPLCVFVSSCELINAPSGAGSDA